MTKQEQRELVENLLKNMTEDVLSQVEKFPKDWDGRQIRQYIVDYAETHITWIKMSAGEKRSYNNDIRVGSLK